MKIFNKYWRRRIWYEQVVTRINPRNKWARKIIPRHFTDVDYLYEEILFAGLIFFWEKDNGEEVTRYQWDRERDEYDTDEGIAKRKEVYDALKEAYEWAKIRRSLIDNVTDFRVEQEYIDKDTKYLLSIVSLRKYMWS